jgi:hypothetical protein
MTGRGQVRAGPGGFRVSSHEGAAPQATGAATVVAPLGLGLLAIQGGGDERERNERAAARAESLLEEIAGLQRELLGGAPDPMRLQRLAALQQGESGADPALQEVVAAISLRAQVELARRERAAAVASA